MPSSARCTGSHQPPVSGSGKRSRVYPRLPRAEGLPKGGTFPSLSAARDRQPSPAGGRRSALAQADPPNIFSFHRARRILFLAQSKGAPAAPRAVGKGGARERAQFSPQAEMELSGLCDDAMGGASRMDKPPGGNQTFEAAVTAARPFPLGEIFPIPPRNTQTAPVHTMSRGDLG